MRSVTGTRVTSQLKTIVDASTRWGVIVLELTKRNELDAALLRLTNKLARITATLRSDANALEVSGEIRGKSNDAFSRSVGLLGKLLIGHPGYSHCCVTLGPCQWLSHLVLPGQGKVAGQHVQDFAAAHPIEN